MKNFKEVVKMRRVPATFVFRCTLCNLETTEYDWHSGLIKMNDHVIAQHSSEVETLDKEELYSRRPTIRLDSF